MFSRYRSPSPCPSSFSTDSSKNTPAALIAATTAFNAHGRGQHATQVGETGPRSPQPSSGRGSGASQQRRKKIWRVEKETEEEQESGTGTEVLQEKLGDIREEPQIAVVARERKGDDSSPKRPAKSSTKRRHAEVVGGSGSGSGSGGGYTRVRLVAPPASAKVATSAPLSPTAPPPATLPQTLSYDSDSSTPSLYSDALESLPKLTSSSSSSSSLSSASRPSLLDQADPNESTILAKTRFFRNSLRGDGVPPPFQSRFDYDSDDNDDDDERKEKEKEKEKAGKRLVRKERPWMGVGRTVTVVEAGAVGGGRKKEKRRWRWKKLFGLKR